MFVVRGTKVSSNDALRLRNINNEEELIDYYVQNERALFDGRLKIWFVRLEALEFPEDQRALVSMMGMLLGVAGAGLNWQWWLPPGARIVQ